MSIIRKRKKAVISNECVACGACISHCRLQAIHINKGMNAIVHEEKCVGCGKCMVACPGSVIAIQHKEAIQ